MLFQEKQALHFLSNLYLPAYHRKTIRQKKKKNISAASPEKSFMLDNSASF